MGYLKQSHSLVRVSVFLKRTFSSSREELKGDIHDFLRTHEYKLMPLEARSYLSQHHADRFGEMSLRESFNCINSKWSFKIFENGYKSCRIGSAGVFAKGYLTLQDYLNDVPLPKAVEPALNALERFYENKDLNEHGLRLLSVCTDTCNTKKRKVSSLLAQHLLSQLLPHQSNYFLDKTSINMLQETNGCPCGCKEPINFGLTQLGSPMLFNGSADIVLFPMVNDLFRNQDNSKSAVFTVKSNYYEDYDHKLIDDDLDSSDEMDEDILNAYIDEDMSAGENEESSARHLYKQAISMSLCKKKRTQQRFSNSERNGIQIIPVCAVTNNSYSIAMYDAENDFLLKLQTGENESLKLFEGRHLKPSAILDLWLMIHHKLFLSRLPEKIINRLKGSCNLINVIGEKKFEKIVENSDWLFQVESFREYQNDQRTDIPFKDLEIEDIDSGSKMYPIKPLSGYL